MSDVIWTEIQCFNCGGHGQVSSYAADGSDFLGADECNTCEGRGCLFQSHRGAIAKWPGGPFVGRATAEEMAK